jgi:hypothetical protein
LVSPEGCSEDRHSFMFLHKRVDAFCLIQQKGRQRIH